jgi:dienelactone hydrolase
VAQEVLAAELNEIVFTLSVTVKPLYGRTHTGMMPVTEFRPDGDGPFPLVVMNHGRSEAHRAEPARWRYESVARYFVRRGFAVMVPTRLGYGSTGLVPDPEDMGPCNNRRIDPGLEAAATEVLAVLDHARTLPYIDARRMLIAGQSAGGMATIAAIAKKPEGVIGAINFSGGLGGDPAARPGTPCDEPGIRRAFKAFGARSAVPTLWMYSANDRYWGPDLPKRWHRAYTEAGGQAEFREMPAYGDDGHRFIASSRLWAPVIDGFLTALGFSWPALQRAPVAASGFARIDEVDRLPFGNERMRKGYTERFLKAPPPRAFAIASTGNWGAAIGEDAEERALANCARIAKQPCALYAVDDEVVWAQ